MKNTPDKMRRIYSVVMKLNELEMEALDNYCKKYHVKNRSKLIREALMTTVLKRFDDDYPSLFDNIEEK